MTDPPSACPLPRALRMAGAPAAAVSEGEEGPATPWDSLRKARKGWRGSSAKSHSAALRGSRRTNACRLRRLSARLKSNPGPPPTSASNDASCAAAAIPLPALDGVARSFLLSCCRFPGPARPPPRRGPVPEPPPPPPPPPSRCPPTQGLSWMHARPTHRQPGLLREACHHNLSAPVPASLQPEAGGGPVPRRIDSTSRCPARARELCCWALQTRFSAAYVPEQQEYTAARRWRGGRGGGGPGPEPGPGRRRPTRPGAPEAPRPSAALGDEAAGVGGGSIGGARHHPPRPPAERARPGGRGGSAVPGTARDPRDRPGRPRPRRRRRRSGREPGW